MKRSFKEFVFRLDEIGLRTELDWRAKKLRVSLRDLYEGERSASICSARRVVYLWLLKKGKSVNEIARLFDRAPSGIHRMTRGAG